MNKRIITLGLLIGVLSLNSCVKDNESDEVQAQRQAQTEKLKAEAGKLMADKTVAEAQASLYAAQAKVQEELAAYTKASNELKLAQEKAQNETALVNAQAQLEDAKVALERAKEIAKVKLEEVKLEVQKKKDKLAEDLKNYVGDHESKVLKVLDAKFNAYSTLLEQLGNEKSNLITQKQTLVNYENTKIDVEKQKEESIATEKAKIEVQKQRIEYLKKYAAYSDVSALEAKLAKIEEEVRLAANSRDAKQDAYVNLDNQSAKIKMQNYSYVTNNFVLYQAVDGYLSPYSVFPFYSNLETKIKREGVYTVSYDEYDVNFLPKVNIGKVDIYLDKLDQDIKSKETDLENATQQVTNAQQDVETKKAAYEADKTDAAKEAAYKAALSNLDAKEANQKSVASDLEDLKDDKKKVVDAKSAYLNPENRAEVKKAFEKYNKLQLEAADKFLEFKKFEKDVELKVAERDAIRTAMSNAKNVSNAIAAAEQAIVQAERDIADVSSVSSQEQLVANQKAKVANIEAKIAVLEKQVAVAKKAYEDTLASI